MSAPPPHPDTDDDRGIPRWVKVSGIIVLVVALLIVVLMSLDGGGEHGPGRHAGPAGGTPAEGVHG